MAMEYDVLSDTFFTKEEVAAAASRADVMGHAAAAVRWVKACEYDHISPDSLFVVFSPDNPFRS